MSGQRRITAKEARALQPGTRLTWHGYDGEGFPTRITGTVVQYGREKRLRYIPERSMFHRWEKIREEPNMYYTIEE